jgi:23S rRNA pseudouridine2605 synthase
MPEKTTDDKPGERIAKVIARAGLASRRTAEGLIAAGRVAVNGTVIASPALNVSPSDTITVDGVPLPGRARTRLFRYHKPRGLVTTHSDPQGRQTIFATLPKRLPRLVSVGRLDLNSEGLLLLTNDGGLARALELPATGWERRYRVRALGRVTQDALKKLRGGVTVAGVRYGPIEAALDREQGTQGANVWLTVSLREGKNREVRKVLEHLGLKVNRLIRVSYGPFELGAIETGAVEEVETEDLRKVLGPEIAAQANADFEGPLEAPDDKFGRPRPSPSAPLRVASPSLRKRGEGGERPTGPREARPDDKLRRQPGEWQKQNKAKKRHRRRDRRGGPRPSRPK